MNTNIPGSAPGTIGRMDLQYILARTQDASRSYESQARRSTLQPPVLGLLTRTLVRSPVTKWIFPARIRREDKNDVVFIRENSIEIMEFQNGRSLQDVAVKTDFDAKIRAARIIGAPKLPADILQPVDDDALLKLEIQDLPDKVNTGLNISPQMPPQIPPQILVMVLGSGSGNELVFLFAFHDPEGLVRFAGTHRALPQAHITYRQLETHLAVDPQ